MHRIHREGAGRKFAPQRPYLVVQVWPPTIDELQEVLDPHDFNSRRRPVLEGSSESRNDHECLVGIECGKLARSNRYGVAEFALILRHRCLDYNCPASDL